MGKGIIRHFFLVALHNRILVAGCPTPYVGRDYPVGGISVLDFVHGDLSHSGKYNFASEEAGLGLLVEQGVGPADSHC